MVLGVGCRAYDVRCRVQGVGCWVPVTRLVTRPVTRVRGFRGEHGGLDFGEEWGETGMRFEIQDQGFGFQVSDYVLRVEG